MSKETEDKKLQGEGDYQAAKRYRKSARNFVKSANVEGAAKDAAPDSTEAADEMKRAEKAGASRSKGEGSLVSSKNKTNE